MKRIREFIFERMSEQDAREIYLPLIKELDSIGSDLLDGRWNYLANGGVYHDLYVKQRIRLLSKELQEKLRNFHDQQEEFESLAEIVNPKLKQIFEKYRRLRLTKQDKVPPIEPDIHFFLEQTNGLLNLPKMSKNASLFFDIPSSEIKRIRKELATDKDIVKFLDFKEKVNRQIFLLTRNLLDAYQHDTIAQHKIQTSLTIISISVALLLAFVAVYNVTNSNRLIDRQLDSLSPINPDLQIFGGGSRPSDLYFSAYDLAHPLTFTNGSGEIETWNKEQLYLVIQNVGQLPAGYVNIRIDNDEFHITNQYIEFLNETSTESLHFQLWKEGCGQGPVKNCEPSQLRVGKHKLLVSMNCQFCRKEFQETIEICIYDKSRDQCKE